MEGGRVSGLDEGPWGPGGGEADGLCMRALSPAATHHFLWALPSEVQVCSIRPP